MLPKMLLLWQIRQSRLLDSSRLSQLLLILLLSRHQITWPRNHLKPIRLFSQMSPPLLPSRPSSKKRREANLRLKRRRRSPRCSRVSKIWSNLSKLLIIIALNGRLRRPKRFTPTKRREQAKHLTKSSERRMRHSKNKRKNSKTRLQTRKKKSNRWNITRKRLRRR